MNSNNVEKATMRLDNLKPLPPMTKLPAKYEINTATRERLVTMLHRMKARVEELEAQVAAYEHDYSVLISPLMQQVMTLDERRLLAEILNKANSRLRDS